MGQFLKRSGQSYAGPPNILICSRALSQCRSLLSPHGRPFVYAPFTLDTSGVYHATPDFPLATIAGIAVSNYQVFVDGFWCAAGVTSGIFDYDCDQRLAAAPRIHFKSSMP